MRPPPPSISGKWDKQQKKFFLKKDSDCLVVNNIDYLFRVHEHFRPNRRIAATRDIFGNRWRAWFNSGVFVIRPAVAEFERLIKLKNNEKFLFDPRGEQYFLNEAYKNEWLELGFAYNANSACFVQRPNYWRKYQSNIRVIHFTMEKPWACSDTYKEICDIWRRF